MTFNSDKTVSRALEAATNLKVKSALNPILWLCAIITIPTLSFMGLTGRSDVWIIILAFTPVIAAVFGFIFLLVFDRDKLQSEEFQLKNRSLDIIQQKGDSAPYIVSTQNLNIIPKPDKQYLLEDQSE